MEHLKAKRQKKPATVALLKLTDEVIEGIPQGARAYTTEGFLTFLSEVDVGRSQVGACGR